MKKFLGVMVVLLLAVSFLAACVEKAPAEFTLSGVTASPSTATVNDTVTISALVTNVGEQSGDCDVSLTIDGYTDSESVTLAGGESTGVSFSYAATTEGSYDVTVSTPDDSETRTLTVTEEAPPPPLGAPVWSAGDNWVYTCSYENPEGTPKFEDVELSVTVVGEVAAGEEEGVNEASYHLSAVFVPEATRDSTHPPVPAMTLHVGVADVFNSVANIQFLKQSSSIEELPGLPAGVMWAYAPGLSFPSNVGDTWDFTKHTLAGGGLVDETVNRQGKVLEIVDITVPAGTFSCYHIVEYDPATPDTYTFEHWFNVTVVKSDVKMIDRDTWDGAETRVLVSYPQ